MKFSIYFKKLNNETSTRIENCGTFKIYNVLNKLFLIIKNIKKDTIELYSITKSKYKEEIKIECLKCDLLQYLNSIEYNKIKFQFSPEDFSNLDQIFFTHLDSLFGFKKMDCIYYIDIIKNTCLHQAYLRQYLEFSHHNTSVEAKAIFTISGTNNVIIYSDKKSLVYVEYNNKRGEAKCIQSPNGVIYTIIQSKSNVLATYVQDTNHLIVYDLNRVSETVSFKQEFMKQKMKTMEYMGISDDLKYICTFEKPKFLSLFRLKDANRIAYLKLYSGINDLIITSDYVCLAMKDSRMLSLLIVDPQEPLHGERLVNLPSRYV